MDVVPDGDFVPETHLNERSELDARDQMLRVFQLGWSGFIGGALAIFPPLGMGALAATGATALLRRRLVHGRLELAFLVFALSRVWVAWRIGENPGLGFLQGALAWLLFRGAVLMFETAGKSIFAFGMALGLSVTVGVAFIQVWETPQPIPSDWIINAEGPLVRMDYTEGNQLFIPINRRTAYIVKPLYYQGSGEIQFRVILRSSKEFKINFALIHSGLPNGRIDQSCLVQKVWNSCVIHAKLSSRQLTLVGLGGFDTWKGGDPAIEIQLSELRILSSPSISERLALLPRVSGWTFNPNAFGALCAVLGVLVLIFGTFNWLKVMVTGISLVGILLSGSRAALLAAIASVIMLSIARSRYRVLMSSVAITGTILIIVLALHEPNLPLLRAVNVFREDGFADRTAVYGLAWRAIVESPLIGVGALRPTLQLLMDQEAKKDGGLPGRATHAHNLILQTLGEGGLIALLGLGVLWAGVLFVILRYRAWAALAALVAIGTLNTFDYLLYFAPVYTAFSLVAAFALASRKIRS